LQPQWVLWQAETEADLILLTATADHSGCRYPEKPELPKTGLMRGQLEVLHIIQQQFGLVLTDRVTH
jgi:hypothetical protein